MQPEELAWDFADARLKKTANGLHAAMVALQTVCVRKLGQQRSGEVRFGRWLRNARVSVKALVEGVCGGISKRVAGRHVLRLEDTSEINYPGHAGRVQGRGTVGNGQGCGVVFASRAGH